MGCRFVQVDLDFVDSKSCGVFALGLGLDRDTAAGKMLRVWGWAVAQAIKSPKDDPLRDGIVAGIEADLLISEAARWTKTPQEFAEAGERAGLFGRTKRGVRLMGWEERYGAMLRKMFRDALKPRGNREGRGRDAGGTREGFPRVDLDLELDVDVEKETVLVPDRSKPRKQSWQEAYFGELQASRSVRLKQLGVEAEPEKYPPAFVNLKLGLISSAAGGEREGQDALLAAYDAYLEAEWPAAYNPPYNFKAFASEKVWRPLLVKVGVAA